jgi:hypothetical protein
MKWNDIIPKLESYGVKCEKKPLNNVRGMWMLKLSLVVPHKSGKKIVKYGMPFYVDDPSIGNYEISVLTDKFLLPSNWWENHSC